MDRLHFQSGYRYSDSYSMEEFFNKALIYLKDDEFCPPYIFDEAKFSNVSKIDIPIIKAKGIAEAEAIDKKAEAMKKYGQAAIVEMLVNVLPEVAKNVAEPMSAIDKVTVIGGNSNGVSDVAGNVPIVMAKVFESVKEATGIDMTEIVRAQSFEGKTTKNVNFTGIPESTNEKIIENKMLDNRNDKKGLK